MRNLTNISLIVIHPPQVMIAVRVHEVIKLIKSTTMSILFTVSIAICQVVADGYSYSITLDQEFYQFGDTINASIQMTNTGSDTIIIISPWWFDLLLIDSAGTAIDGLAFIPIDNTFIIPPADSLMDLMEYPLDNWIVNNYMSTGVYSWLMKPFYNYESNIWDTTSFYYQSSLSVEGDPYLINGFIIDSPYPNPANPTVNIAFDLDQESYVRISVFDLLGRELDILLSEELQSGSYKIDWNMINQVSGVYIIKYEIDGHVITRKFALVK